MAERTCSVADCERPYHARDFCTMHHQRWRKHGDPTVIGRAGQKVKGYTCSVVGCGKRRVGRGWCKEHWQRWSRTGSPYPIRVVRGGELIARLLSHIEVGLPDECWPFYPVSMRTDEGYARLKVGDRYIGAHRIAYECMVGPIPAGLFVCHSCDNPPCCNPAHLWPGTPADNVRDMIAKGRGNYPGHRKLTEDEVRRLRATPGRHIDVAPLFGVHPTTVSNIKRGLSRANVV